MAHFLIKRVQCLLARLSSVRALIAIACLLSGVMGAEAEEPITLNGKMVIGWVENIYLMPWQVELKAKLDSGARTSSLHAQNIERFKKDGERWVRFQLITEDSDDNPVNMTIERPLERRIRVKDHDDENDSRPVVTIPVMLGNQVFQTQFSLADRSKFIYPVLLGRRMLKDVALIDPDATFVTDLPPRTPPAERTESGTQPEQK